MENKQRNYLDKVIEYLVRDTKINYKNEKITTPFLHPPFLYLSYHLLHPYSPRPFSPFTSYCKEIYGLTDQEIKYVWKEYTDIIKDKVENGK